MPGEEETLRDVLTKAVSDDQSAPTTTSAIDNDIPPIDPNELPPPSGTAAAKEYADRQRDQAGRFTPKTDTTEQPVAQPQASKQDALKPAEAPGTGEGQSQPATPPPGWSPTAKAAFGTLPNEVKEAVSKREMEINNGLKKLQDYKSLDPYVEMARNQGTTLPEALGRYIQAEQVLQNNPIEGIRFLCQTYGIDPRAIAGLPQQQGAQPQGQTQQQPPQFDLSHELPKYLTPLQQQLEAVQRELINERQNKFATEINAFASSPKNVYFENVADQMAALLKSGIASNLQDAYDKACRMDPEIHALTIKEQRAKENADQAAKARQVAASARQAGVSVTGGSGTPPVISTNLSLREELEAAYAGGRA